MTKIDLFYLVTNNSMIAVKILANELYILLISYQTTDVFSTKLE